VDNRSLVRNEDLMVAQRVRWAVLVYGRAPSTLQETVEAILREYLEPKM